MKTRSILLIAVAAIAVASVLAVRSCSRPRSQLEALLSRAESIGLTVVEHNSTMFLVRDPATFHPVYVHRDIVRMVGAVHVIHRPQPGPTAVGTMFGNYELNGDESLIRELLAGL